MKGSPIFISTPFILYPFRHAGEGSRTPESSLEDSHVAVYITPASKFERRRCGTRTRSLGVRSAALLCPFELTARGVREVRKREVDGGSRTRVSGMARRCFSRLNYVH